MPVETIGSEDMVIHLDPYVAGLDPGPTGTAVVVGDFFLWGMVDYGDVEMSVECSFQGVHRATAEG